jgi:hypothetical protein
MIDPDHWGMIAERKTGLWRVTYGDISGLEPEEYLKREIGISKPCCRAARNLMSTRYSRRSNSRSIIVVSKPCEWGGCCWQLTRHICAIITTDPVP